MADFSSVPDSAWVACPRGKTEFWPREAECEMIVEEAKERAKNGYPDFVGWAIASASESALDNALEEIKRLRGLNKELRRKMKSIGRQAKLFERLDSFTAENGSDAAALYRALFADDAIHLLEAVSLVRTLKEKANAPVEMDRLDEASGF